MNPNKKVLVIADGAAFGSEIDRVLRLLNERKNSYLYLPESFEWLVLSSDILKNKDIRNILTTPADSIDSKDYFSWEQFFTALLVKKTEGTYFAYSKRTLNHSYLTEPVKAAILSQMNKILLDWKTSQ